MTFEMFQDAREYEIHLSWLESGTKFDSSDGCDFQAEIAFVFDVRLERKASIHRQFAQFGIGKDGGTITHIDLLDLDAVQEGWLRNPGNLLRYLHSNEVLDLWSAVDGKEYPSE